MDESARLAGLRESTLAEMAWAIASHVDKLRPGLDPGMDQRGAEQVVVHLGRVFRDLVLWPLAEHHPFSDTSVASGELVVGCRLATGSWISLGPSQGGERRLCWTGRRLRL